LFDRPVSRRAQFTCLNSFEAEYKKALSIATHNPHRLFSSFCAALPHAGLVACVLLLVLPVLSLRFI
jgi:hypothetical protein